MSSEKNDPEYAVIFISKLGPNDKGYDVMADRMERELQNVEGYLGMSHARSEMGITVCFWRDRNAIRVWKENAEHREAQKMGRSTWYTSYEIYICKVEESRMFESE